jgi:hypothetical protein
MTSLIVGASGETGKHLVNQLLEMNQSVKVIVRSTTKVPATWKSNPRLNIIEGSITKMGQEELLKHLEDCDAVASCLGHNLSFKGIYGKPRKLVTQSVSNICIAIKSRKASTKPVKFVLMNTAGNRNRDLKENISFGEKMVIGLIRILLPPQPDNEKAADHLRTRIGKDNPLIEWAVVRPDGLINLDEVTEYEIYPSPIRSAIFNAGKTSRINVANFMATLITDDDLWMKWKGQMPVLYNKEEKDG